MNEVFRRLDAGLRGRYRLEREVGSGGAARVYLAADLRHGRKVAVKVLREELAAAVGPQRFLAEIRTMATLQHPHILPLFDSGEVDGLLFYVMPWVDGESLRVRLIREEQLPVHESVAIAAAVAGALAYAHERGIVHRDVKPANILLSGGEPLVADFGIALALREAGGDRLTETGLAPGTPRYMSPEQASGDRVVDERSDVYSLGCVLYEMLTGEPPHAGRSAQAVLGKILTESPRPVAELRPTVPPHVAAAVARALERLPADRFGSAKELARALEDPTYRHPTHDPGVAASTPGAGHSRGQVVAVGAVVGLLGMTLGATLALFLRSSPPGEVFRATVDVAEALSPMEALGSPVTLSPDGALLVYVGTGSGSEGSQLWVRRADALDAMALPGTEDAHTPIFSPDGEEVAFAAGGFLKAVGIRSGVSRILTDSAVAPIDWSSDGLVYFESYAPRPMRGATWRFSVRRVAATGGKSEVVPGLSEGRWVWGDVLPGGRKAVWADLGDTTSILPDPGIHAVDLETGEVGTLVAGSTPRYRDGVLLWVSTEGALLAAPFDPRGLRMTGQPISLVEGIRGGPFGTNDFAVSAHGDLAYEPRAAGGDLHLVWVDRAGRVTQVDPDWRIRALPELGWEGVSLSPDDSLVAVSDYREGVARLWVKSLRDDSPPHPITFDGRLNARPGFTPDGGAVTFVSDRSRSRRRTELWSAAVAGGGAVRRLAAADHEIQEGFVSPDGAWVVYRVGGATTGSDIYALHVGDSVGRPLVATDAEERMPELSPDGRWLAYVSDQTDRSEVFVRPFPDVSLRPVQVSDGGGESPLWSRRGPELFYLAGPAGRQLWAARVQARGASLVVTARDSLFTLPVGVVVGVNHTAFDVATDDRRFLMLAAAESEGRTKVVWVRNWSQEMRRRLDQTETDRGRQ